MTTPEPAERLCCSLYHGGHVDYVVSHNDHCVLYDAKMLKSVNMSLRAIRQDEEPTRVPTTEGMTVLDPVKLRRSMALDREKMLDVLLLCGTDYTERLRG